MGFLATASSQVFGPVTIVSRNCTHISIKTTLNPNRAAFNFLWVAIISNGTSKTNVRSILSAVFIKSDRIHK